MNNANRDVRCVPFLAKDASFRYLRKRPRGHNRSFGNIKDQRGSRKMKNFDFTQFVSFDSVLPYQIIYDSIVNIFEISDFEVISIKDIESVKKEYFSVC